MIERGNSMFCKYCGKQIPDGGICSCEQAQRQVRIKSAQNGQYAQGAQSGQYSQNAQSGQYRQNVQGGMSGQYSGNVQSGQNSQYAQGDRIGQYSGNAQSGQNGQYVQGDRGSQSGWNAQSGQYPRMPQADQTNSTGNGKKSSKTGSKKLPLLIAAAAVLLAAVAIVCVVLILRGGSDRKDSGNDADQATLSESENMIRDEAESQSASAAEPEEARSVVLEALIDDYDGDYAKARKGLDELDVSTLGGEDADRLIEFQTKIEEGLKQEMKSFADAEDYMGLFKKLTAYETELGDDSLLQEIRDDYEPDFVMYLQTRTQQLADEDQKDEALAILDEAGAYLSDASIAEDLRESVENAGSEYVIEDSDSRYLTKAELADYSLQEINYAKNEIYARHGRKFDSKELQDYFNSKSWYKGTVDPADFSESVFNEYEKQNVQTLKEEEFSRDSRGYQLDQ